MSPSPWARRHHAAALRAQERRELVRRAEQPADLEDADPERRAIAHLTLARVAALQARRVNAASHISEAIRILERPSEAAAWLRREE